jgi:hypothetical protein
MVPISAAFFSVFLSDGNPVDEEDDVVAVVAVVGVDAELVDDLEVVFAPVLDVDQGVGKRGSVIAGEIVSLAQDARGGEDVGGDELVEEALELAVGQLDAVEGFEFLAEVRLQRCSVVDVAPVGVLQRAQPFDEFRLDVLLVDGVWPAVRGALVGRHIGGHWTVCPAA